MANTIILHGATYTLYDAPDQITLQRYNETHKMQVTLHFPKGRQAEKKRIEEDIVTMLSNHYIARNTGASIGGGA